MRRATAVAVPPGAPAWITPELLDATLRTWNPHYREALTAHDAVQILLDVGRLIDLLENPDDETVCGPGPGVES